LNTTTNEIKQKQQKIKSIAERRIFMRPEEIFRDYELKLDNLERTLNHQIEKQLQSWENKYNLLQQKLSNLSPLKTLERGYSILQDQREKTVNSIDNIKSGDLLTARLSDGRAELQVNSTEKAGELNE
ncbi:MAG: exodeoxyribonuclease VII large subunit, partial [Halanaerobium sp. MSAO_Bac5]